MSPPSLELIFWLLALTLTVITEVVVSSPIHRRRDRTHRAHERAKRGINDNDILRQEVEQISKELDHLKRSLALTKQELAEKIEEKGNTQVEIECRTRFTWWYDIVGKSLEHLDVFDVHCHQDEVLKQWRMSWGLHGSTKKAIRFQCCKIKIKS